MPAALGPTGPDRFTTDREIILREAVWLREGIGRIHFSPSGPDPQAIRAAAELIEADTPDGRYVVEGYSIQLDGERIVIES